MDRSKYTTLCTYSTWIHTSRIQGIYHFQILKYIENIFWQNSQQANIIPHQVNLGNGRQHCMSSTDSDLEAFNRNPTDGSFTTVAFQLTAFTKYLNEVFLSY